jgi:polyvinyl alcohol dehydrogenase (cytochrome)
MIERLVASAWLPLLALILFAVPLPGHAAPQDSLLAGDGAFPEGAKIYRAHCAGCHDAAAGRAPQKWVLQQMSPEAIQHALTDGAMRVQSYGMTPEAKAAVAEHLANRKLGSATAAATVNPCRGLRARFDRNEPPVFDGWGLAPGNTHSISSATAGITPTNAGHLRLKWAFGFPGAQRARSQATLAGGAIFVGSHTGRVYALDRETGCVRWTFDATAEVRTAVIVQGWRAGNAKARPLAWFGDAVGNMYAVEAFTGRPVWKVKADRHPAATITGTPALYNGTLYVPISSFEEAAAFNPGYTCCSFRGSLVAMDAATGREKWRTWLVGEPKPTGANKAGVQQMGPSGVPVWNTPAIDPKRNQLTIGTGDNYSAPDTPLHDSVLALDLATGRVKWRFSETESDTWNAACTMPDLSKNCPDEGGPDFDFGAGTILGKTGNGQDIVLAGSKSGTAFGLAPDTGKLLWRTRLGHGGVVGGINFGMATAAARLFVPVSDAPDAKTYALPGGQGIYGLDLATGAKLWGEPVGNATCQGRKDCNPGFGGAISATPGLVFAGADDGHLRVFASADGKVLWDHDTFRDYTTVNGVPAHGGSIGGGAAPIAYRGLLIASSGYGYASKMPGNVLLVFTVK